MIFRQYGLKDGTLYKNDGKYTTALVKGSANATNSDDKYITPWRFRYNPSDASQLALKTEYGVNRYFHIAGETTPEVHATDSSLLTFHYVDVLTNDNANEEELVKLQYGADKWLKFRLTGGSGAELVLVDSKDSASVFSWSYLNQEYTRLRAHVEHGKARGVHSADFGGVFAGSLNKSLFLFSLYRFSGLIRFLLSVPGDNLCNLVNHFSFSQQIQRIKQISYCRVGQIIYVIWSIFFPFLYRFSGLSRFLIVGSGR